MTAAHGALAGHGLHVAAALGPLLLVAVVGVGADLRAWCRRRGLSAPGLVVALAMLGWLSAAIHLAVCPEHLREGAIYGAFFAAAAAVQMAWNLLVLVRPAGWVLAAGAVGNLAEVVLWLVTRTAGIPLGPEAGAVESAGVLDIVATTAETGVVALCIWMLLSHGRRAITETRDHAPDLVVAGAGRL